EILDNETELTILEHTSDTAGYTDLVFGLFDLLGMRFCPRIRDIADALLYQLRGADGHYPDLASRRTGRVNFSFIEEGGEKLLGVCGSLQLGYAPTSLLIAKFQKYPR